MGNIRQIWQLHWHGGYSINELAKRFKIPYSTLYYRLKKDGHKTRSHHKSLQTKKTKIKYSNRSSGENNPNYGRYGKNAFGWKYGSREFYYAEAHRVWERNYGKIPEGLVLHHVDKNCENNDVSNLRLVTWSEHQKIHESYKNLPHIKEGKCQKRKRL